MYRLYNLDIVWPRIIGVYHAADPQGRAIHLVLKPLHIYTVQNTTRKSFPEFLPTSKTAALFPFPNEVFKTVGPNP